MITNYTQYCLICGKPKDCEHHLLRGSSRKLADADGITIPLCDNCHTVGRALDGKLRADCKIHKNAMAENLSLIIGQLAWEKNCIIELLLFGEGLHGFETTQEVSDYAREEFRKRYERSWL